jgi:hypothetical protein
MDGDRNATEFRDAILEEKTGAKRKSKKETTDQKKLRKREREREVRTRYVIQ